MLMLVTVLLAAAPTPDGPLARLHAWVGPAAAEVAGYDVMADCKGPRGPYRTRLAYRRSDGWARFTQWRDDALSWDSVLLDGRTWLREEDGSWSEGDPDLKARILGHHYLAMVLAPERVFVALGAGGKSSFEGEAVEWISGQDVAGHPLQLAVAETGRPVAVRVTWPAPTGPILFRFLDWKRVGRVQLPMSIRIEQGTQLFEFHFRPPVLRPPEDAGWSPPGRDAGSR